MNNEDTNYTTGNITFNNSNAYISTGYITKTNLTDDISITANIIKAKDIFVDASNGVVDLQKEIEQLKLYNEAKDWIIKELEAKLNEVFYRKGVSY